MCTRHEERQIVEEYQRIREITATNAAIDAIGLPTWRIEEAPEDNGLVPAFAAPIGTRPVGTPYDEELDAGSLVIPIRQGQQ